MGNTTEPANTGREDLDAQFMRLALGHAHEAELAGEVPVGAVVVKDGQIVSHGHNAPIANADPTAHAEIVALRAAARSLGNYRLDGCTLFVTLEPCAMCAGAMMHARLARVVYGAFDPKTGAAGSIVDLFSNPQINYHTQVHGGVLAHECSAQLRSFFRERRGVKKAQADPLREDALRTPDGRFRNLPGYPWDARYINNLPTLAGLRMHYVDEGPRGADTVFLCLHGNLAWGYAYREMVPAWLKAGHRVVVPDLIGFGKSDKPKRDSFHTFDFHLNCLLELVEALDLRNVVLVMRDGCGLLGSTLSKRAPERFRAVVFARSALKSEAFDAPFPDSGHRAALRAFSTMAVDPAGATAQPEPQIHSNFLPLILLDLEQFGDMPDAALATQLLERLTTR